MKRRRAIFKLPVRYCNNNVEQIKAEACAEGLKDKDVNKFWKSVYKLSNNKATNLASCVGGCSGAVNVVKMRKEHFEDMHNKLVDSRYQALFLSKLLRN